MSRSGHRFDHEHKLDFCCLKCVKRHIDHKEKLLRFVKGIASRGIYSLGVSIETAQAAERLLEEIGKNE